MDAIETEFVPVFVRNNEPGRDAELCARYREPAWNNPVLRFFAGDGRELLPRADGVYAAERVAERLVQALAAAKRPVPGYLALALEELRDAPLERAVFAMSCFWRGEGVLGSFAGVRTVQAAWLEGREVVDVRYAPAQLEFAELVRRAQAAGCAQRVWVEPGERLRIARGLLGAGAVALEEEPRPAQASDHEHELRGSAYDGLPLTPLQRVRLNARLAQGGAVEEVLAPFQRALLQPRK